MQNFGPQTLAIGSQTKYFTGVGWEYLTIINESPYILDANFSGIGSITIPAWFQEDIRMPSGFTGQVVLTPNNYLGLTQIVSQLVSVNAWSPGELPSRQNVGLSQNFGNIVTSTATNLVNDGNPAGTTIVEATQAGSTGSNVILKNDGTFNLFQFVGGILTQLLAITPGVPNGLLNSNVIIGDANHQVEIPGHFKSDVSSQFQGTITVQVGASGIAVNVQTSQTGTGFYAQPSPISNTGWTNYESVGGSTANNGLGFMATGNHQTAFDASTINSGTAFKAGASSTPGLDVSAITTATQGIKFAAGTLTRIVRDGPYTVTNVSTAFNHSLGVVPDVVIPTIGGASATTLDVTYDFSTMTSTQVKLQCNIASLAPVYIVSIKF